MPKLLCRQLNKLTMSKYLTILLKPDDPRLFFHRSYLA